jgi:hypothetical protein
MGLRLIHVGEEHILSVINRDGFKVHNAVTVSRDMYLFHVGLPFAFNHAPGCVVRNLWLEMQYATLRPGDEASRTARDYHHFFNWGRIFLLQE